MNFSGESPVAMWRSLLFVPVHKERFVAKADSRGADAVILDLEDAVPSDAKALARSGLAQAVEHLTDHEQPVGVRINVEPALALQDIEAAAHPGVATIVVPKVETPAQIQTIDEALTGCEEKGGLPVGRIRLIAMLESALGIISAHSIATASPRMAALALGPEDLATDMGCAPTYESMIGPCRHLLLSARAAGVVALGFPGSIANFDDEGTLHEQVASARALGYTGALCIHPHQVGILNEIFSPTDEERDWARRVMDAYNAARQKGEGVAALDGRMIDLPVVRRARAILARSRHETTNSN